MHKKKCESHPKIVQFVTWLQDSLANNSQNVHWLILNTPWDELFIFKGTFIFLSTCVFTRIFWEEIFHEYFEIIWLLLQNEFHYFVLPYVVIKISKFRWVLILSFPNCVYTWLSIFLSLRPKSETDRKNLCLSTKLNIP